jgi:hypothetical protein
MERPLIHSNVEKGIETIYNSWDPLTILEENGRLGSSPLLIRLKVGLDVFSSSKLLKL